MGQIVVLPYYLFTGVLMQRIQRQVQHLCAQYPQIRFACTPHFGLEPEIFSLLERYASDLREGRPLFRSKDLRESCRKR